MIYVWACVFLSSRYKKKQARPLKLFSSKQKEGKEGGKKEKQKREEKRGGLAKRRRWWCAGGGAAGLLLRWGVEGGEVWIIIIITLVQRRVECTLQGRRRYLTSGQRKRAAAHAKQQQQHQQKKKINGQQTGLTSVSMLHGGLKQHKKKKIDRRDILYFLFTILLCLKTSCDTNLLFLGFLSLSFAGGLCIPVVCVVFSVYLRRGRSLAMQQTAPRLTNT